MAASLTPLPISKQMDKEAQKALQSEFDQEMAEARFYEDFESGKDQ